MLYHPPPTELHLISQPHAPQRHMPSASCRKSGTFEPEWIRPGIDWLTFITDDRKSTDSLVSVLTPLAREQAARGEKKRPFRFMGWKGESLGGVRLGIRGDTAVAQLSGELCNDSWTLLRSSPGRVTRLDLQATLKLSTSRTDFARRLLRHSARTRQLPPERRTPTSYSSATSGLRIGTAGLRTRRSYLRVYDKGAEAETHKPGILWRVELEAKRDLAPQLWNRIKSAPDVPQLCYDSCAQSWKQAGLRWPLPKSTKGYAMPPKQKKEPPPAHALGAWLRTSVAPTIPRVLAVYSVADVLDMLGMSHLAIPAPNGGDDENP